MLRGISLQDRNEVCYWDTGKLSLSLPVSWVARAFQSLGISVLLQSLL